MNILNMLEAANTTPKQKRKKARTARQYEANKRVHALVFERAKEKYRKAMEGKGWMMQAEVEAALDNARGGSTQFLHKLLAHGLVTNRNRGGGEFKCRLGRDWMWVSNGEHHMTDIIERLKEPEARYPGNFDTPKRANAMLSCLCQEAAEEIEHLRKLLDRIAVRKPDGSVAIRLTEDALNAAAEYLTHNAGGNRPPRDGD